MTAIAIGTVWSAALLVTYVYAGYPLILWILTRFRCCPVLHQEITPTVTLLISAYNEAPVIGSKLKNALALDYPPEQLEILVISDASTDGTDSIVESFYGNGVKLLRLPERQGKTRGLNAALQQARGEIVLFSDANMLYRKDVVRMLVLNFVDPDVGW